MIVVIPIHNQSRNISVVLTAYLTQTLVPSSIVLVCDRCTDSSAVVALTFTDRFKAVGCSLYVIDTSDSNIQGFGAGRTRDIGIQFAIANSLIGPFLFSDGDCIPSKELVAHHFEQLSVSTPRITCGLRYETLPSTEKPTFPLMPDTVLGMVVQDDLRMNAEWCKHLVFGVGFDRLVLNPQVFEKSWICWSCNLGMNRQAINLCYQVNGMLDGDVNRVFNSEFDGRWGGEDGFVGLTLFRMGYEVVALHRRSNVTHIWHPRNQVNQEHLLLVARKDAHLKAHCLDGTLNADATLLTGLRRWVPEAFDLGFLELTTSIKTGSLLAKVSVLFQEPFIHEAISLFLAGTVRYAGGLPALVYVGDRDQLGRQCYWAKGMMPWISVAVNGTDFEIGRPLLPYQDNSK